MNTKTKYLLAVLMAVTGATANAASIDSSIITQFGCTIYEYLTGPLATWGFIIAVIAGLVIGFFTSINWGQIITVVALFAVVQSVAEVAVENESFAKYLGTASCLQ